MAKLVRLSDHSQTQKLVQLGVLHALESGLNSNRIPPKAWGEVMALYKEELKQFSAGKRDEKRIGS